MFHTEGECLNDITLLICCLQAIEIYLIRYFTYFKSPKAVQRNSLDNLFIYKIYFDWCLHPVKE